MTRRLLSQLFFITRVTAVVLLATWATWAFAEPTAAQETPEAQQVPEAQEVPEAPEAAPRAELPDVPPAPPASDSPPRISGNERAELHFELAEAHFAAERYEEALVALQTVREITGSDEVLYNMGRCYEAMGRPTAAVRQYERFLAANIQGSLREDATDRLANLEAQLAGAGDDGEAPGPGVGTYIGLALGGAGLAVGTIFGLMTLVEDGNLMDGCGAMGTCSGEELSDIRAYRTVADLAFMTAAIAGTAGVIALILWATEGDGGDGEGGADTVRVTPYVVPGEGAGASASVRF